MMRDLEEAVAFAEHEREEAHAAFRRALSDFVQADGRLLDARLALEDERALARPSDTTRKARR